MTLPKLICAGVGLKPYFPAGISSAAATRLLPERCAVERKASETGAAGFRAAPVAARQQPASAMNRNGFFMVMSPGWGDLGVRLKV